MSFCVLISAAELRWMLCFGAADDEYFAIDPTMRLSLPNYRLVCISAGPGDFQWLLICTIVNKSHASLTMRFTAFQAALELKSKSYGISKT